MPNLDEFLTSSPIETAPEPTPEPVAVETAPPVEPKGVESAPPAPELPPRGEDGKWIKREDAEQRGHMVPLEALLAEREKRQTAERAAEERRNEPKPDFWENPEAAVDARVKQAEARLLEEAETRAASRARELFLNYTEGAARGRYTDYDQMRQVFSEEAQRNPVLATQLREATDPAEFIYRQGRTTLELREVGGDLSAYRKRVQAEERAKVEREYAEKAHRTASIPQSLNTEPSKGAGIVGGSWAGPPPLEDILPYKRD